MRKLFHTVETWRFSTTTKYRLSLQDSFGKNIEFLTTARRDVAKASCFSFQMHIGLKEISMQIHRSWLIYFAGFVSLFSSTCSFAAVLKQSTNLAFSYDPNIYAEIVGFESFDSNLGSLTSVEFSLVGSSTAKTVVSVSGNAAYPINFADVPSEITLSISGLGGTFYQMEADSATGSVTSEQPTFTSSGTTYAVNLTKTYSSGLSNFESNGFGYLSAYQLQYGSFFLYAPPFGSGISSVASIAELNSVATVTYNYEPITASIPEPEPYAMALVGFGLLGLIVGRRKQQEEVK